MQIGDILNKLEKVKRIGNEYKALCPAHEDKEPSLTVKQKDNQILIHCFAGCPTESIVEKLGLQMSDLFIDQKEKKQNGKIVATYDYQDEQGNLLLQVMRFDPKSFRQRHRNGNGEWQWDTKSIRKVIYHLPDILRVTDDTIFFVEGEKDADALWNCGLVATTSPGGANAWRPDYAQYLAGKRVTLIPDNDTAGYNYAKEVARSLIGKAKIKCILLPSPSKDISDWLSSGGNPLELLGYEQDISALLDADKPKYEQSEDSILWHKTISQKVITFKAEAIRPEKTGIHGRISILCDYAPLGWSLFNIERAEDRTRLANSAHAQLKGEITEAYAKEDLRRDLDTFCAGLWDFNLSLFTPELMQGDETDKPPKFVLYPYILEGGGTILFAPPGKGKSFTALAWAVSINSGITKYWPVAKTITMYINLERSRQSLTRRLAHVNTLLGLPKTQPLLTLNARGKSLSDVIPTCRRAIKQYGVKFIILDSISRAGYGDLTENLPVNKIIDSLSELCDTWLALAHTPRGDETHVFGGIHFDAGADIVIQLSSETKMDSTLGVGYEITKKNDLPTIPQSIWAFEFSESGLSGLRKAKPSEFPEVESKSKKPMLQTVIDWIQDRDMGDATATEVSDELGYNRVNIAKLFSTSGRFIKTRNVGRSQYYGVKEKGLL